MSIPFVWREIVWDPGWGTYRGRAKSGHTFVDGGVLSNFPIRLIAESDEEIAERARRAVAAMRGPGPGRG